MKNVLIVGAGGIGSWLGYFLNDLDKKGQFEEVLITFADDDTVDTPNLSYQKFQVDDISDFKAEVMADRYGFESISERITTEDVLIKYDCIISCVDGKNFRELLFKTADKNPELFWIDLRSEGRTIVLYSKHERNTLENMLKTLPKGEAEDGSCQREYEKNNNIIQQGNKIIALIASQQILNWIRNEGVMSEFIRNF